MAYGPSGSGKTHTMFGSDWEKGALSEPPNLEVDGVIPNTVQRIFEALKDKSATVYASFLAINNEKIFDLL